MAVNTQERGARPINDMIVPAGASAAQKVSRQTKNAPRLRLNRTRLWLGSVLVMVLLGIIGWFGLRFAAYQGIDTSRYQAVYLDNDNVYFGKVSYMVNGDVLLQDVFRVQAGEASGNSTDEAAAADIRLIKPGNELHAPDDTMRITRSKVLFIENLKTDGKVTEAISSYHKEKDK